MFLHLLKIILNFLYVSQSVSGLTSLLKICKYRDISCSCRDMFLKFCVDIPGMLVHQFQNNMNFLHVCQSVIWPTSLLKLDNYRDISSSGWDIFLKFVGDISGILAHQLHTILNFLYVCQSVSWITSLLKLDKYKDISSSRWDVFLKSDWDISGCSYTGSKSSQISCMSVSLLVGLLSYWNYADIGISPHLDDIYFCNFWRLSLNVSILDQNNSEYLVCM